MRSKLILFLALVMGVITTGLFFNYLKQFDTEVAINEVMVEVVVPKQRIMENQRISAEMLEVKEIPEKGMHPNSIQSILEVEGKYATSEIEKGEPILQYRVKTEKEEALFVSRKVQKGFRAVSVGVNFVQSVANLIEPEDQVDVIFSEVIKLNGKDEVRTELILAKVKVLAVGRKMIAATNEEEEQAEYSSVTLELKPADTVKLVNASERGNVQLTLHTRVVPPSLVTEEETDHESDENSK